MLEEKYALAMLNLILSVIIGVICVCRINAMNGRHTKVRHLVVFEYVSIGTAMFVSGLSPLMQEWPGYARITMDVAILISMLASNSAWQRDEPPPSATRPGAL